MISLLIGILIICVVGAICFWAIDKFVRDGRLANLLKLLVVLICLALSFSGSAAGGNWWTVAAKSNVISRGAAQRAPSFLPAFVPAGIAAGRSFDVR